MRRLILTAILTGGLIWVEGCMTYPAPHHKPATTFILEIDSNPPGAEIWTDPTPSRLAYCAPTNDTPILLGVTPYRSNMRLYKHGVKVAFRGSNNGNELLYVRTDGANAIVADYSDVKVMLRLQLRKTGLKSLSIDEMIAREKSFTVFPIPSATVGTMVQCALGYDSRIHRSYDLFSRTGGSGSRKSIAAKLRELKSLRDTNIITEAEYQHKRKAILDEW